MDILFQSDIHDGMVSSVVLTLPFVKDILLLCATSNLSNSIDAILVSPCGCMSELNDHSGSYCGPGTVEKVVGLVPPE